MENRNNTKNNCVRYIDKDDAKRMNSRDTLRNDPTDGKEKEVTSCFA